MNNSEVFEELEELEMPAERRLWFGLNGTVFDIAATMAHHWQLHEDGKMAHGKYREIKMGLEGIKWDPVGNKDTIMPNYDGTYTHIDFWLETYGIHLNYYEQEATNALLRLRTIGEFEGDEGMEDVSLDTISTLSAEGVTVFPLDGRAEAALAAATATWRETYGYADWFDPVTNTYTSGREGNKENSP
jgi:hypothetical protein